jgi:hypothetical protein
MDVRSFSSGYVRTVTTPQYRHTSVKIVQLRVLGNRLICDTSQLFIFKL